MTNSATGSGPPAGLMPPPRCVLCSGAADRGRALCAGCSADLPRVAQACPRCALAVAGFDTSGVCARCAAQPPRFHRSVAPLAYDYPTDRLLLGLKFGRRAYLARALAEVMSDRIRAGIRQGLIDAPDALVPVPLHPKRLAERGFNQAEEIARFIGRDIGVPVSASICRRVRHTRMQSQLSDEDRHANVAGAFACSESPRRPAIVDDVVTTGATVDALAGALAAAGAEHLHVWAVARA